MNTIQIQEFVRENTEALKNVCSIDNKVLTEQASNDLENVQALLFALSIKDKGNREKYSSLIFQLRSIAEEIKSI